MPLKEFHKKMFEMHKSPMNWVLHLIAGIVIVYALWMHKIIWVIIGIVIALAGHVIQAVASKKPKEKDKKIK